MSFYRKSSDETMEELNTSLNGLSSQEAAKRKERYGANELKEADRPSALQIFIDQFKDLIVIILIVAALISGATGDLKSTIVIIAVLILNAILGTTQTLNAQKSVDSLKSLSVPKVKVIRDGQKQEIDSTDVTIGDLVVFEAGDMIVADARIVDASSLQVNESALTGESHAVDKTVDPIAGEVVIGDQTNMVFTSSQVTYGNGSAIVTDIGENTEIGKISSLIKGATSRKSPLQRSIDEFSKHLSMGIMIICVIVFGLVYWNSGNFMSAAMFAIALAVAAVPEALASIITIVESLSCQKLAKENAIMKSLNSVETLGSVSVIASDKTGTLTQNKMTVNDIYLNETLVKPDQLDLTDKAAQFLMNTMVLTNDSFINGDQKVGDPTELALIELGRKYGITEQNHREKYPRVAELPFDSVRKYMSTLHDIDGQRVLLVKGAPDELLRQTTHVLINGEVREITSDDQVNILNQNNKFAEEGLRVLGYAFRYFDDDELDFKHEDHLTFVGLTSMIDPPREESKEAVAKAIRAGIKPIMITGDHVVTGRSIARKIGIFQEGDMVLDGATLEKMSDEELARDLEKISVYARVAPEHKIRIVNAWQAKGKVVGMSGDGVNDAPALKQADIGIAMGITGSEVSKDAADMILTDDNFATIIKAVTVGRNLFANIKNAIKYLLTGNSSAIIVVILTTFMAFFDSKFVVPFLAIQLLFINLVTDSLPAISIGMEEGTEAVLDDAPRDPNESILTAKTFKEVISGAILIAIAVMVAYLIGVNTGKGYATTFAFLVLCLGRLFHGFSCRSDLPLSKIGIFSNKNTVYAFLVGLALVALIVFVPAIGGMFGVVSLSLSQILTILGLAFAPTLVVQAIKMIRYSK
ncbi:cation-translocating P-type ATPase [Streptococcus macedonicus]|uniref:Cation-transporting ATPase n=1 Tax=Streptococcus infantarius TaxID=102684 RepID=A0A380KMY5_9STRE|nr:MULTISPECIES: cation-translocating P-type ATPase [Streptococcus]MCO4470245.1 cation transporter/ATPase [Streptococcus infantarius subsp. infantarius]CCF02541.1 Probable cation-transporting ATPase [Streptococcus macedonicus ACA-DC 198]MBF6976310.1 cation-translocating P-type ATPase [Streptococcus macedonicus]MCO4474789.1 cation transporter/ATPase [Streptococcus infantarius subsp. infantarius]MCO4478264.1 cation transporter/ATPase [Streptococcus infantarius subsp. infantarius]